MKENADAVGKPGSRRSTVGGVIGVVVAAAVAVGVTELVEAFIALELGVYSERSVAHILLHPTPLELWHRVILFLVLLGLGTAALGWRRRERQRELALAQCRQSWEGELARSERQLRLAAEVFESSIEGIVVTDVDGTIQTVNPAFTAITGYSAEEAVGQNPRILKSNQHPPEFYQQMWQRLGEQGQWSGEIWNRHKSGRAFPEWLTISAIRDLDGTLTGYVSVFHDLSELRQREEEMRYLAHHDPLTGIANRLLLDDHAQLAIAQARRTGATVGLIYADLDGFKQVNDLHGHAIGDQVLQHVAKRVSRCVREEDTVARLGGDEFVVLVPGLGEAEQARRVMESIATAIGEPFVLDSATLELSASLGVAFFPAEAVSAVELLCLADQAMYRAKAQRRNRVLSVAAEG